MISIPRTLAELSQKIRGDMRRELPGTDANVWPNNLSVFGKVFALAIHEIDLRGAWLYRQIFASLADGAHLERHAYEFGLARKQPSRASGFIETTASPSTIYPAGIGFLSGGAIYRTAGEVQSLADGTVVFQVYSEGTGSAMNRDPGEVLSLADVALFPDIANAATVGYGGIGGAADREDDNSLRARVLDRKRRPPQGGALSDYEQIARAIPGVSAAWAYSFANGPGTIGLWFLFEGRDNGIPTLSDVQAVKARVDLRRLIRARGVFVSAPYPSPVDIQIRNLSPDTAAVRAKVEASLAIMFKARAQPGVAAEPFTFSRSWIAEAISSAIGEDRHELVLPAADITYASGEIPVLGAVTYV
ncbi:MAG: baseplate J protein [Rhizobiales bacterium]|nr:baseplate J protein [Hyphomicrobiales bacterium]